MSGAGTAADRAGTVHVQRDVDGVPGTTLYSVAGPDGRPVLGPRVAVVAQTHGNEPVGALVLERLEPMLPEQLVRGEILVVVSNVEAMRIGRRHTPGGTDLNRLWDTDTLEQLAAMPASERCYEHRRALELAPLLQRCVAILDLHSASQPAPPFLVVRDDQRHAELVKRLGVQRVVTGLHEEGILEGGVCPDVGLLLGERSDRVGLTFEAGQHSDPDNRKRAFELVVRFLDAFDVWRTPPPPALVQPQVFEVIDVFRQAPAGSEQFRFPGWEPGNGGGSLASGRPLASFERVEADEVLLKQGDDTVVRAPSPFTMLLPTPTADPGTDLYYVALERQTEHRAVPLTDATASIESTAIERMLDRLADDQLARGATWTSFHGRQVLDIAAELCLQTVRLPLGHPHRRLAIVGRGDWGGGSSEARAGRRYRRAFRLAISEGVPIDRYQLLRGATLSWLDALTSEGMANLLARRTEARRREGLRGTGIRMFLSAQRPSAVALIVAGDLQRALAGDERGEVRVGLIIEAPIVEADGPRARVRIRRFGLFSARTAFLRTADALLQRLQQEHSGLVRQPPLADDPVVHDLLGPGDALVPPSDLAPLRALGVALQDLQLRLWRDALRHEVVPHHFETPDERGRWLAQLMTRTGVLDRDGLAGWLIGADGHVDPSRLDRPECLVRTRPRERRTRIRPPIRAAEVDKDTLPRWSNWLRFVHARQVVPDTRGEDVDLVLDSNAIQAKLVDWLRDARALAADNPGRVQIVMAGDGLRPGSGGTDDPLVRSHLEVLLDPNLRYLRIQHAQGSYLRWLKGLVRTLRKRPDGPAPAGIRFERGQGSSMNVVLLAVCDGPVPDRWTLDGWRIERCAALVSSVGGSSDTRRVGVFTEPLPGPEQRVNAELLQFGRAHCQSLLDQGAGPMIDGDAELAEALFVEQISGWIERARYLTDTPFPVPDSPEERAPWLQARLGLADSALVRSLVREMDRDDPPLPVARAIWDIVVPWPEF